MPVAKIHVLEGRYDEPRLGRVSDEVQQGLISALGIPPDDFFQIIHVLPPKQFLHTRSFLGLTYSDDLILLEITFIAGRPKEKRLGLLKALNDAVVTAAKISPEVVPTDRLVSLRSPDHALRDAGRECVFRAGPRPTRPHRGHGKNEGINMTIVHGQRIVLAARPKGKPAVSDFRLEKTAIPTPAAGQLLLEVQYLSLDPYMRGPMNEGKSYATPLEIGDVMTGESVAQVLASNNSAYAKGDIVLARTGWQTHALSDGAGLRKLDPAAPATTGLGVLGMPGFTAYGGLRVIGKPQPGETVVVAAASGPVGSLVGQLAQLAGSRAVGIAGSPQKCAFVRDELRFDAAVDHRAADFPARLAAACPDGIDLYFENVGGAIWETVLPLLNEFARVPVAGLIAQYNGVPEVDGTDRLPVTMGQILSKLLTVRGFIYYDFAAEYYGDFLREVGAGIAAGRIRYREDIVDGLETAPSAFIGMLEGRNFGKLIVRVA